MRISSNEGDAGYPLYESTLKLKRVKVYFNGVEQHHCTVADDEAGFIERAVLDECGRLYLDPLTDEVPMESLQGDVKIVIEDDCHGACKSNES